MKHIYVIIFLWLALPVISSAQYENIRQPLTDAEISLYKKNKVMGELQKIVEKGTPKNYKALALDTSGRLLASISYGRNQYYMYDELGRVTAHLDSLRNSEGKFVQKSYAFTYYPNGKLQQATIPEGEMNFSYDAKQNILTQNYNANDTLKFSKFYFDGSNRIYGIEGYSQQHKLIRKLERAFSTNGTLHREEITGIYPAGTDSTIIIYLYDAKKQLQKKQVFSFRKFYVNMDNSKIPTHSAEQQSIGTVVYTYDKKGNKIAEEYTNSVDKLAGYYITWEYNEKGLIAKKTIAKGKAEPDIIIYEYAFFE